MATQIRLRALLLLLLLAADCWEEMFIPCWLLLLFDIKVAPVEERLALMLMLLFETD